MKRYAAIGIILAGLATSCARFTTVQTDTSVGPDGTERTITTRAAASTFFASKSALANWKATQTDKTQGASVGSLTQETQEAQMLGAVVEALVRALKTP